MVDELQPQDDKVLWDVMMLLLRNGCVVGLRAEDGCVIVYAWHHATGFAPEDHARIRIAEGNLRDCPEAIAQDVIDGVEGHFGIGLNRTITHGRVDR